MAVRASNAKMVFIDGNQVKQMVELFGTSGDSKPTTGYANGSTFLEVDTGKIYLFNESTSSWVELQ